MVLDLQQLLADGRVVALDVGLDLPQLVDEQRQPLLDGPGRIVGEARPEEGFVRLSGTVHAGVRLTCSRCLEPFAEQIESGLDLRLVPDAEIFGAGEAALDERDVTLFYATGGRVRLGDVLAEQVLLALPMKAVCREDCAGLCPTCGANRNRIDCGCRREEIDPRLAPLLEFRKPGDDS